MVTIKASIVSVALAVVSVGQSPATVSIDLGDNPNLQGATLVGAPGVAVAADEWIGATGSADGSASQGGVTVSWDGNFYLSNANNGSSTQNHVMMNGAMGMNNDPNTFVNVQGLGGQFPSGSFDIYVYFANDTARSNGVRGYDDAGHDVALASASAGVGHFAANGYVNGTNYVVLRGFGGSQFTLTRGPAGSTPQVAGIQIVETAEDQGVPAAPESLVAISSNYKVSLSWDPNGETDLALYRVFRKEGTGEFREIADTTETSYDDLAFTSGVQYSYYVMAVDLSGDESPASNIVTGMSSPSGPLDLSPGADRPNIILIMSDDQGWGDVAYNGHPFVKTPALDAMAGAGYVFNRFYAGAPNCSPTRATVLTGRTAVRTKVTNHGRYMRRQEMTIAEALRDAGYVTGVFGKVHIGSGQPDSPANPSAMGFDEWFVGLNFFDNNPYLSRNGVVEHPVGKGSEIVIDETIAFIGRHKDGPKPVFALAWFPSPHTPHAEVPEGPSLYDGESMAGYYREITLMDEGVGRIRQYLRDQNIHQNTIVWFCSDNGGLNVSTSGGRGKKGQVYEGGLRVPSIIEWPARNLVGATNVVTSTLDMYPTLLAMAGITVENQLTLDGIDIRPVIAGSQGSRSPIGFWHSLQGGQTTFSDSILSGIMTKQQNGAPLPHNAGRMRKDIDQFPQFDEATSNGWVAWLKWPWKLHRTNNGASYELYNLETDPMETANLYSVPEHAALRDQMRAELIAWQKSVIRSLNGADYGKQALWLPLNRTEGLKTYDANGSLRGDVLGTPDTSSHWIPGEHDRALRLDGSGEELLIGESYYDSPVGASARTISAWINTQGGGPVTTFGNPSVAGGACNISLDSATGRLTLEVGSGSITGASDLRTGTWRHIAVVIPNDGSPDTSECALYVDGGAEVPSAIVPRAIRTNHSDLVIGGVRSGSSPLLVDEFRITPIAETALEIMDGYASSNLAAAAWQYRFYGNTGPIDWSADTDGDDRTSLLEYALGTSPLIEDPPGLGWHMAFDPQTNELTATITRRRPGTHSISYSVQLSDDLVFWTIPVTLQSVANHPDLDNGLFEQATFVSDLDLSAFPRAFARLEISPLPQQP